MGVETSISWTDHTFNPWWGCQRVSPGCEHCYAETFAKRVGQQVWGPPSTTERRFFGEAHWNEPLKWDRRAAEDGVRRRVFCASMADVFEDNEAVSRERNRLWGLISITPHLDWLLLTKRPENIAGNLPWDWDGGWPNVWLGTTTENQEYADKRIPHLLAVPAAVRFLSCEPLLGPIKLPMSRLFSKVRPTGNFRTNTDGARQFQIKVNSNDLLLHWLIAGGESGGHARPMHPDWARSLRDQCAAAGIAYHLKQWGEWAPAWGMADHLLYPDGRFVEGTHEHPDAWQNKTAEPMYRFGKKRAGRLLDGLEHNAFPAPAVPEGARP